MNTLPTDLLLLIDKHTSYVEETLVFYSSRYQNGIHKEAWKNYLHHLHRQYDQYDQMFSSGCTVMGILEYMIHKRDYVACRLLVNVYRKHLNEENLHTLLERSIAYDDLKLFRIFYDKTAVTDRQQIINVCFNSDSINILRPFINGIDISTLNKYEIHLAICATNFDSNFIKKVINNDDRFQSNKNKMKLLTYFCYDDSKIDPGGIVKMLDLFDCGIIIRRDILFTVIDCNCDCRRMLKLLETYDRDSRFGVLVEYFEHRASELIDYITDVVGSLRLIYEHQLITDDELIKLYKRMIKVFSRSGNPQHDEFSLDNYSWITNKYIEYKLDLDLIKYNDKILNLNMSKYFGKHKIAIHILSQYPQLPINRYSSDDRICDSVYALLYQRDKINIDEKLLLNCGYLKCFKLLISKLEHEFIIKWVHRILLDMCRYGNRKYQNKIPEFVQYLDEQNIDIDYQHFMEVLLGKDIVNDDIFEGEDGVSFGSAADLTVIDALKFLDQHGKIRDNYRLLKLSKAKKHKRVSKYLSKVVHSKPLYGYL